MAYPVGFQQWRPYGDAAMLLLSKQSQQGNTTVTDIVGPPPYVPSPLFKEADTRYISMGGSDANPGDEARPWRTLARVLGSSPGVDVFVTAPTTKADFERNLIVKFRGPGDWSLEPVLSVPTRKLSFVGDKVSLPGVSMLCKNSQRFGSALSPALEFRSPQPQTNIYSGISTSSMRVASVTMLGAPPGDSVPYASLAFNGVTLGGAITGDAVNIPLIPLDGRASAFNVINGQTINLFSVDCIYTQAFNVDNLISDGDIFVAKPYLVDTVLSSDVPMFRNSRFLFGGGGSFTIAAPISPLMDATSWGAFVRGSWALNREPLIETEVPRSLLFPFFATTIANPGNSFLPIGGASPASLSSDFKFSLPRRVRMNRLNIFAGTAGTKASDYVVQRNGVDFLPLVTLPAGLTIAQGALDFTVNWALNDLVTLKAVVAVGAGTTPLNVSAVLAMDPSS